MASGCICYPTSGYFAENQLIFSYLFHDLYFGCEWFQMAFFVWIMLGIE